MLRKRNTSRRQLDRIYASLLKNMPGEVYRCRNDRDWTMEFVSDGVQALTGYLPEDFLSGRVKFGDLLHPDDAENAWRACQEALARREPYTLEYRVRARDGTERWVWERGSGVFDRGGNVVALEGFVGDVTDRKRSEEALRAQTERLLLGQSTAGMVVMDWDVANDRLSWSASPEWLRGPLPPGGEYPLYKDQVHPEDRAEFLRVRQTGIERPCRHSHEYRVVRTDGRVLWILSQRVSLAGPDGKVNRMLVAIHDITRRKNAEEALRASERRFRALVELSSDWYWQTDAEHRFTARVGDVLASMGIPSEADLGKRRSELGFLNMRQADWDAHYAMLERREEFRDLLLERRGSGGRVFWATISGRPLYDESGAFLGYHGIGRDITAQVEAERALQDLNGELEARVAQRTAELKASYQELESFSYSVSHDLRAPLRAISGFAGILREDEGGKLSESGLRHLSTIDASAQQMGKLVDALLELVRMSRHAIVGARLDVTQIAREVATQLSREYPMARIEVHAMPCAVGDAVLVRQVFANLIGNALKYSAREQAPRIEVAADGSTYFVRDNGIGFDMRFAGKLFKPFERLHADPGIEGTGIGLALASLIVHRHGGRIEAESAPGEGATFRFTLGGG